MITQFIQFKLDGTVRTIKVEGSNSFIALDPRETARVLGYYSNLPTAVMKHIKESSLSSSSEEVVELKDYVAKFKSLCKEVLETDFETIIKEDNRGKGRKGSVAKEKPTEQIQEDQQEDEF